MKITKIETFKAWAHWSNWLFVKVSTDEGIHGWGEATLHGPIQSVEAAIHEIGQVLIGKDPSGVEYLWHLMYNAWRWRGGPTLMTAIAGLDIALWDIEGKRLGVPVYRLLGGPFQPKLRVYASHWLEGVKTPEEAYEGAKEAVRRGFSGFKWVPFKPQELRENETRAISKAVDLMAAAREGAGPEVDIYIECAEFLSPRTAVLADRAFASYRPAWFEEPVPYENARLIARLQQEISVPIATGERLFTRWEFRELLESGGCKIIQPDLMHAGGITEVKKIAALADTYYIPVAPHNPAGPICNLASMHLATSIPNFYILEQMENDRQLRDGFCSCPVQYEDGYFELPTSPGLGTDLLIEDFMARGFRAQPALGRSARWL